MKLQELVERKMKEVGITSWSQLAKETGIDSGNMSKFRNGKREGMRTYSWYLICKRLGNITTEEFISAHE